MESEKLQLITALKNEERKLAPLLGNVINTNNVNFIKEVITYIYKDYPYMFHLCQFLHQRIFEIETLKTYQNTTNTVSLDYEFIDTVKLSCKEIAEKLLKIKK